MTKWRKVAITSIFLLRALYLLNLCFTCRSSMFARRRTVVADVAKMVVFHRILDGKRFKSHLFLRLDRKCE